MTTTNQRPSFKGYEIRNWAAARGIDDFTAWIELIRMEYQLRSLHIIQRVRAA